MTGTEKTFYVNGRIFTADNVMPEADAMLVKDGRILWVGKEKDADPGDAARVDLQGRRVIPGFVDAHMHPVMLADFSKKIAVMPPKIHSIEEMKDAIRARREQQGPDQWVEGWGYDEEGLAEKRSPNRYDLDEACGDAPVSILRTCAHIRCVNSRALELAGIDRNTPDPPGGEIERDENGEPTGVLKENASNYMASFLPVETAEQKVENLLKLGELLNAQGVTSICDMGNLDDTDNFPIYKKAAERGFSQKVGIYYMWSFLADRGFTLTPENMNRNRQIFAAGLKLIGDGSVSGRTAWMNRPFRGSTDEYGISVCPDALMESAITFCKENHCQLSMHAMGGRAIERMVDRAALEETWTQEGVPYVRIEHVTDPTVESIRKAKAHGISFVTQPIFMYAEAASYRKNLGVDWMRQCYPVRTMMDEGVLVGFSTDAPATYWAAPSDPLPGLKQAVTRVTADGTDCGKEQAVDIRTAIILYTREAARAAGFPDTGMLVPGYHADFVVLDRDILSVPAEEITDVLVLETYADGRCVYRR